MRTVIFASRALGDYKNWATGDKKTFKKIIKLIKDIDIHPFTGIGKPEPLKHELAGYWSRRINRKDRLVYKITEQNKILIISCKEHYM
jgi:toxin YoeB